MKKDRWFCVKLIHCGNKNVANPDDRHEKSNFFIPMGVFPMAANLKKHGFDVEMINLDLEERAIEDILEYDRLDAVGLDCHWVNQGVVVLETVQLIKKMKPGVFLFLGGYTAGFFSTEILEKYPAVDAIIKGDAEVPIVELCSALQMKKIKPGAASPALLETIPNLVWRGQDNEIITNRFSYVATANQLDQLDFGAVDLLRNWNYYKDLCTFWTNFTPLKQFPVFFLEIGRGCTYNCSFCGGNANAQVCLSNRKGYAVRSIDSVISTVKKAVSFGYSLMFSTFEFEGSEPYFLELFRRIKEEGIKTNFGYGSWAIPSKLLVDTLSRSVEHGIIEISPETADLRLREKNKDIRLFYSNEELEELLDHIAGRPNIKVQLYFSYFLLHDTEESVFVTMDYITKLFLKYSGFVEIFYSNLSTDPSSSLYLNPEKYNVEIEVHCFNDYLEKIRENYIRDESATVNMTLFRPADMTAEDADLLTNKIELFKLILSLFGYSLALILNKTGESNIILDHLRAMDLSGKPANEWTAEMIRNLLLEICSTHHIQSIEIKSTIDREYENASLYTMKSRQINRIENREVAVLSQEEKDRISSNIKESRTNLSVDFDI